MGNVTQLMINSPPWHDGLTGRAQAVDRFDVTPRITYRDGKAVKVTSYAVRNGFDLIASEYGLNEDGKFTEFHFDPEHGGDPAAHVVPESGLAKLDSATARSIPLLKVLGKNRVQVEAVLKRWSFNAYHFDSE